MTRWGGNLDADVLSFFARSGLTDATQRAAVATMVSRLKTGGLWPLLYALWPLVGGSAAAHAENLMSSDYAMTWVNSPTHSANGVAFNGTTQYGNTGFNAQTAAWNDCSLGAYINSAGTGTTGLLVAQDDGTTSEFVLNNLAGSTLASFDVGAYAGRSGNATLSSNTGLIAGSRAGAADKRTYQNGSLINSATGAGASPMPNLVMFLAAYNYMGSPALRFNGRLAFAWIGRNLSTAQHSAMYTIVQAFQTTLGRNV
jgi:hypothetical protein